MIDPSLLANAAAMNTPSQILGADWPNLLCFSEHLQANAAQTTESGGPKWVFRIELDTRLDDNQAQDMLDLLRAGKRAAAMFYLLHVRAKNPPVPAPVVQMIVAAFAEPVGPLSAATPTTKDEVMVRVVEDYAKGKTPDVETRIQLDVPLSGRGPSADEMRALLQDPSSDPKRELDRILGSGKTRALGVVDAALRKPSNSGGPRVRLESETVTVMDQAEGSAPR